MVSVFRISDIVVQDVTCKTNRYEMALSLFIILDENRNVRLVIQIQKLFGNKFYEFFTNFHTVRNTLNELSFELEWNKLIIHYPETQQYLINTLYNTKESWVHP
ncbi:hypothetical protein GLOIN_2v1654767 [Rhizophagus clarus]|nr:hypothetical protein GLOIN_2v1654767 [Rhizophagus clarus]